MTTKKLGSLAIAIAAFAVACSDPLMPTRTLVPSSASGAVVGHPISFVGGGTWPAGLGDGRIELCKTADAAGSFDFTVTTVGTGLLPDATPTITIPVGGGTVCAIVYTSAVNNASVEQVIITEAADQPNWSLTGVNVDQYYGAFVNYPAPRLSDSDVSPARGATIYINNDLAKRVTFVNDYTPPPPPPGNNGCTPGYWKQSQHFDSWPAGYTTGMSLNSALGLPGTTLWSNSVTLLQALGLNGGGTSALARHAAAALLNAASGFYPMSVADVQAAVLVAYNNAGSIETQKNLFAGNNELGCTLN